MTGESTTLGEMSLTAYTAMIQRLRETVTRHGYDAYRVSDRPETSGVWITVRAVDRFNARDEWSPADVPAIVVDDHFTFALSEDAEEVEASLHAFVMRQPNKLSRERAHIAWTFNNQAERCGHYSKEAAGPVVAAIRRAMDESGLVALTQSPVEG
ncbi:hypothetical protein [Thalassobaculum litoreum]|uniref:Uncharacterized protein n=1 Tax=Thalassobaculum litoreum DSM 18839 TaxID=1123362 RepID=A0A8G2BK09_9PROT|nr:hypothetical protein [Thalassobaculum litoreum]SDF82545.1 hypothetical protein SAMN05660686_02424 [Thalassobaculum litoreum DSM 18839]